MSRRAAIKPRHLIGFLLLWTLLVLYPNPGRLVISVARIARPPVDPAAVEHLLPSAPRDPREAERFVLATFPYQYDWQTYNVPWYFPTVAEALAKGTGDCKTRFVIFASLLEAMDVPYRQTMSLTHFWVHYEGKEETSIERDQYAWLIRDEEGTRLQLPREEPGEIWDAFREAFWDHMPGPRKALLVAGPFLTVLAGRLSRRGRLRSCQAPVHTRSASW